jgi:hypothetical protein
MPGGSKPKPGSKASARSQDGARKGGGVNTRSHAGPGRASKTRPSSPKGAATQKRAQP